MTHDTTPVVGDATMTPDEIAAERERFEKSVYARTFLNVGRNEHAQYESDQTNHAWMGYRWRAEIARAEHAELRAENERLRAAAAELAEIKRAWGMAKSDI